MDEKTDLDLLRQAERRRNRPPDLLNFSNFPDHAGKIYAN
jgi:hypothetical protein